MPVIDVEVARAWAKERWPSPVVRRCVDFLLTNCPRAKELPVLHCERCKYARTVPLVNSYGLLACVKNRTPVTTYADSTCDDAEEREETP